MEDSRRISEELAEARQHVKIWVGAFAGTALGAAGAYAGFEQTHSPWAAATRSYWEAWLLVPKM